MNACPGCHNPESWDIRNGRLMSTAEILSRVLADEFADVTFTGGDPMLQAEGFAELARAIKAASRKDIWCYTGYRFEELLKRPEPAALLRHVDVLVDGRFVAALADKRLLFRGSSNQRLVDVPRSLAEKRTVLYRCEAFPLGSPVKTAV